MVKTNWQRVKFLNLLPLSSGIGLRLQQEVNKVDVGGILKTFLLLCRGYNLTLLTGFSQLPYTYSVDTLVVKAATSGPEKKDDKVKVQRTHTHKNKPKNKKKNWYSLVK